MSESENSPRVAKSKNLVKIKTKKKKILFDELSFVEDHVNTFYIGLNENPRGAANPLTAKVIEPDDSELMKKLANDWVLPDTQLVKSHHKVASSSSSSRRSSPFGVERKYRPLQFKKEANPSRCKASLFGNDEPCDDQPQVDTLRRHKSAGILHEIFDNANSTFANDHEATLMTPRNYKVFVEDTPVECYGMSVAERRKKGLLK